MDKIEAFKKTASRLAIVNVAVAEKKSLTNSLAWQALFIASQGTLQEQVSLTRLVSKDAPYASQKATVSKAKAVLEHFKEHGSITTKDGATVSFDAVKASDADKMQETALSSLYSAIKTDKPVKAAIDEKEAFALGASKAAEGSNQPPMSKAEARATGGQELIDQLTNDGYALYNASLPVESSLDSVKATIRTLSNAEIEAIAEYAMGLIASPEAVAA